MHLIYFFKIILGRSNIPSDLTHPYRADPTLARNPLNSWIDANRIKFFQIKRTVENIISVNQDYNTSINKESVERMVINNLGESNKSSYNEIIKIIKLYKVESLIITAPILENFPEISQQLESIENNDALVTFNMKIIEVENLLENNLGLFKALEDISSECRSKIISIEIVGCIENIPKELELTAIKFIVECFNKSIDLADLCNQKMIKLKEFYDELSQNRV